MGQYGGFDILEVRNDQIEKLELENGLLKTQVAGLQAALELANERYAECVSAFDDLVYTVDRISIDCTQFSEGIIERDRTIFNLKLELEECKRQSQINDELRSEADVTLESYFGL